MDVRRQLIAHERSDHAPEERARVIKMPVDVRSVALPVLTVVAVVAALKFAQEILIPLVLGVLIAYVLNPIVSGLKRVRVPRPLGAALVLSALVAGLGSGAYALRDQAATAVEQLPAAAQRLRQSVRWASLRDINPVEKLQQAAGVLDTAAVEATRPATVAPGVTRVQVVDPPLRLTDYVWWGSVGAVTFAGELVLLLFLVYFLLASGDLYKRKLMKITGSSVSTKTTTVQILDDINQQIERYLLYTALASAIVAVTTWLAFQALGVQQAAIWGVLAGVFNTIPYFGPIVVCIGAGLVAVLQFGTLQMALLVAGVSVVITSLEGYLLTPWLMSRAAHMNAVAVFVGVLFWGWLWGMWGMLLAVPIMMVVKTVADRVEELHAIGELLGE